MNLEAMYRAARRSRTLREIEVHRAHREYHSGAARFAPDEIVKHDPAMCRSCHLETKTREELCMACLHAVRAHRASPHEAYTVECDGACDLFEHPYTHSEETWAQPMDEPTKDWEQQLREMLDLTIAEEKAVQQQIETLTAQRTMLLTQTLRYTQALGSAAPAAPKRTRVQEATDCVRALFENNPDAEFTHTQITEHVKATCPCATGTVALAIADLFREGFIAKTPGTGKYHRRYENE